MNDEPVPQSKSISSMRNQSVALIRSKSMSRMKLRRQSMGFSGVPGIKPLERTSQLGIEFKRPPMLFLNTYQLEPTAKFHKAQVLQEIERILDDNFTEHIYNVQESTSLAIRLASDIMREIKQMCFNRYRIIAVVTVGQKRAQSYNNAIAFLWDHERDAYVNTQREVNTALVQVTVFGIYLD